MDRTKQGSEPPDAFKRAPRRKKNAVTRVALSTDAKAQYEALARERDQQQRDYAGHLPPDKRK